MNVQYVITDKVRDLWFEDVYYDRQIGARLDAAQPAAEIAGWGRTTHSEGNTPGPNRSCRSRRRRLGKADRCGGPLGIRYHQQQ